MEQSIQSNENSMEIKLDSEGEPISLKSQKPLSPKVIVLVLVAVLLVIFGAVYFLIFNKGDNNLLSSEENVEAMKDEEVAEVEIDKTLDSDQDGLPDYLEKILGTDENNSDTDGDSFDDYNEIKNGYSPLNQKKYTEEEWEVAKEKIKNEDEEFFREIFGVANNINTPRTEPDNFICGNSTVVDIYGNNYYTVKIGEQCWMKENLKVSKNPSGDDIIRYCYDNDPSICETDGGLYDWDTAMNNSTQEGAQGICPDDWHIPSDYDWHILEKGFAVDSCDTNREGVGCDPSGKELISGGSSDFGGIYAGARDVLGGFNARGVIAVFWSSTETEDYVWSRALNGWYSMIVREKSGKEPSFSIRCVKN